MVVIGEFIWFIGLIVFATSFINWIISVAKGKGTHLLWCLGINIGNLIMILTRPYISF